MTAALGAFYADVFSSVSAPAARALAICEKIQAPRLREMARGAVCAAVVEGHRELWDAVNDGANGFASPAAVCQGHTPDDVALVLD